MFGVADYPAFVIAVIVFLAIPGVGNLALITSTGKGGVVGGLAAAFGVIAGDQLLIWLAVAGVAALLTASPVAFGAIQWAGAVYLAWVGWQMIRHADGETAVINITPGHYFRQTALITLLNPKAIVFYMAFFPLFVDPDRHQGLSTFAVMAATVALLTFLYCVIVITLVRTLADRLRASPRVTRLLNRVAGLMLIGFGLKLAISR